MTARHVQAELTRKLLVRTTSMNLAGGEISGTVSGTDPKSEYSGEARRRGNASAY